MTSTTQPNVFPAAARLASVWNSACTGEEVASALSCSETDALVDLFRAVGAHDVADAWTAEHVATDKGCEGHPAPESPESPLHDENGNYTPSPGTEYPFAVSDIARATAQLLGDGWTAESGYWGTTGSVSGPFTASFTFLVDEEGDLCIAYDRLEVDAWPEDPALPHHTLDYADGVYLELASASDGLAALTERAADTIAAVTGTLDTESSASRQHYIDTGRFLRAGEAESI